MGDEEAIGPPEEAEGAPPPQRIGTGIKIRGQPQSPGQTAGCGDQRCRPSQHQSNGNPEREAQDPDALVVAATRCQVLGAFVRPQADALGQNLPHRAISSAVEHLPYKEIVTGSIPVSPISKNQVSHLVLSNQAGLQRNPSGWWLLRSAAATGRRLGPLEGAYPVEDRSRPSTLVINRFSLCGCHYRSIAARVCRLCFCSL